MQNLNYGLDQQVDLIMSLFRGRNDAYAKRWDKNGRNGYSPAYQFDWQEFMAFKATGGTMKEFPNKKLLPLTPFVVKQHLLGRFTVGIYPLLEDNTSYFIAADFDKGNWQSEIKEFVKNCQKNKILVYVERSRSGNGAHAWIFFEEAYPAVKSRLIISELLREALGISQFDKEVSFDRLFPNQDYHSNLGFGNLIALPLYGKSLEQNNTAFLDPETLELIPDQWQYLAMIENLPTKRLNDLYNQLVSTDSPKLPKIRDPKTGTIPIILKNQIFLERSQLPKQLVQFLRDKLNFTNAEYLIKQNLGRSVYKIERYFKLIQESQGCVMIPRGFFGELIEFCQENQLPYKIIDQRKRLQNIQFKSRINLYDFQQSALDAVKAQDFGVIVSPPGSGKTIMGLELIVQKSQPALVLVHRKQLLDQWIDRIQSFLSIPKKEIGEISGRKRKLGKKITVAMMQSLMKTDNLDELANKFGIIIVDECHHIPAKTFRETIVHFDPYYLYGLTATPKRKHNDEKLIFYYIGNILIQTDQATPVSSNKKSAQQIIVRDTKLSAPFDYKIDHYETLSKILVYDSVRNQMIVQDILDQVEKRRRILVLTERKEHVDVLDLYLKKNCETITITGTNPVSQKKSKLQQIDLGHFQVLISTGQFFGEGLDVKNLDCLFLVYPFSFEGKLIQYIGRIQRSQNTQIIYDYRDKNIEYFDNLFKKRQRYYKKIADDN